MSRKHLPWFRVQAGLSEHPKYKSLSPTLRGHLLTLWCIGARNVPRGRLPDLRTIAHELNCPGFAANRSRVVSRVLSPLVGAGFIDESEGAYSLHDWDHWQSLPNQPTVDNSQPTVQPTVAPTVEWDDENKEVTAELPVPRSKEVKNISTTNVVETLDTLFPLSKKSVAKTNGHDTRRAPLIEHITREWLSLRGCSISAAATKADWVAFDAMLKRSANDSSYTVSALSVSFTRFAGIQQGFEHSQGLGYWSRYAYRWFPDSSVRVSGKARHGQSLADEWWRDE
jgi:hypothetical protein